MVSTNSAEVLGPQPEVANILSGAFAIACQRTMEAVATGNMSRAMDRAESADYFANEAKAYGATDEQLVSAIKPSDNR